MSTVNTPQPSPNFYTVGGTMNPVASSYVMRRADTDLLEAVIAKQFCYILTSRQLGKSSLMVRTASSLGAMGIKSVIIDLSALSTSNTTIEQWYLEQIREIADQLGIEEDLFTWWEKQAKLSVARRFTLFLTQFALKKIDQPLVIFIDEIDSTLSLPFNCDDYFAVIRSLYNQRSINPELKGLTFVLLGVASPSNLIKDVQRTPFNIGKRIQLTDFTKEEAQPLSSGLAPDEHLAEKMLDDILHFTGGHPYLSQKTCLHVARWAETQWNEVEALSIVQRLVEDLFLHETGQVSEDDNLQFVQRRILSSKIKQQLLEVYRNILRGQRLPDNELNPTLMELKLSGIIKVDGGMMVVRNVIYGRVFNETWTGNNLFPPSQNRAPMLKRLRRTYESQLEQSLNGMTLMELGLATSSAYVQRPVSLTIHLPNQLERPLPPHTAIEEVYEMAQQELLILGEPGAGKSTLLLELARYLVKQADQDAEQPLPILLHLSSWAIHRRPLNEWLAEEIARIYYVPRRLSQQWIATEQVLPLLDGLDEVEESTRLACIVAINAYRSVHLRPLVVCSRTADYEMASASERLSLHTAIVVQPLSHEEVDAQLQLLGPTLKDLRVELRQNPVLSNLATTPLMLQVLILIYRGTGVHELPHKEADLRKRIWEEYIQHMVNRKGTARQFSRQADNAWLGWLARQMRMHNQTIFFLELIQPDWLPTKLRRQYRMSIELLFGLAFGLLFGLAFGLLTGLIGCLTSGLVVGLTSRLNEQIKPVEVIVWSSKGLLFGTIFGVLTSLVFGLLTSLFGGPGAWLLAGLPALLIGGLIGGLVFGLSREQFGESLTHFPNEGIHRSIRNGLLLLLVGLLAGFPVGLLVGPIFGALFGLTLGLLAGLLVGLLVGLRFGLYAATQHYILRIWLWESKTFPWNMIVFLEDATARILLRRVGGGYSFTHRMLLDYFAEAMPLSGYESGSTDASASHNTTSYYDK